jgi:hypothetical protein
VLLEKSSHWHDENLKMIERYGIRGEWREKSKLAYAKIQQLLDPSYRAEFLPPQRGGDGAAVAGSPPVPMAPNRDSAAAGTDPATPPGTSNINNDTEPSGRRPDRPRPTGETVRQIF